jgi:hypothetical protein
LKQIGVLEDLPEGSSKPSGQQHTQKRPACPRGSSMHRGSSKARLEQHAQGERHKKGSTEHLSMISKIRLFLASNLKMRVYGAPISTIRGAADYFLGNMWSYFSNYLRFHV